jgi:hypothetical protein
LNILQWIIEEGEQPHHFDVKLEAEMEKNEAPASEAIAFPINVFPVPLWLFGLLGLLGLLGLKLLGLLDY